MGLEFSKFSLSSRALLCFAEPMVVDFQTGAVKDEDYSTVTDLAKFLGLSTSVPFTNAT